MINHRAQILVVDDDASVRGFIEELLEIDGYVVTSASNGSRALEFIAAQEFDLAIIDLRMHAVDGISVLRELHLVSPDTSAIILTGHASMETAIKALRLGAHDYLLKPCSAEQLRRSVQSGLERRQEVLDTRIHDQTLTEISNQLRSPVTGIQLGLDLIRNSRIENATEYLDLMKEETSRMERLIDSTLMLTPHKSDRSMVCTAENLNLLIAQVIDLYQEQAAERDLVLLFDPAPNLPSVNINRNQIRQAVTQLIADAIERNSSGNIIVRTDLCDPSEGLPEAALLEVQETGTGKALDIPSHIADQDKFATVKKQSNDKLASGLAVTKEIVEMHGGTIGMETQPHKGNTFRVWLPVTQ